MAEKKYKVDTKSKLTKVAGDLQKVIGARQPAPAAAQKEGSTPPKKP